MPSMTSMPPAHRTSQPASSKPCSCGAIEHPVPSLPGKYTSTGRSDDSATATGRMSLGTSAGAAVCRMHADKCLHCTNLGQRKLPQSLLILWCLSRAKHVEQEEESTRLNQGLRAARNKLNTPR